MEDWQSFVPFTLNAARMKRGIRDDEDDNHSPELQQHPSGIVELLKTARSAAARNVESIMTALYWEIGRRIVKSEKVPRWELRFWTGLELENGNLRISYRARSSHCYGLTTMAHRHTGTASTISSASAAIGNQHTPHEFV